MSNYLLKKVEDLISTIENPPVIKSVMKNFIKLSEWARRNSYTYRGAFGAFKNGKIEGAKQLSSRAIIVEVGEEDHTLDEWDEVLRSFDSVIERLNDIQKAILKLKGNLQ